MGKVNSHNTEKAWEKQTWVSQTFWVRQKVTQFPKYGKSEFSL